MKQKAIDFEEALWNFQNALMMKYGIKDGIVKIGIEPSLFTEIMMDLHRKSPHMSSFTVRDAAEPQIRGVTILPRERKKEF